MESRAKVIFRGVIMSASENLVTQIGFGRACRDSQKVHHTKSQRPQKSAASSSAFEPFFSLGKSLFPEIRGFPNCNSEISVLFPEIGGISGIFLEIGGIVVLSARDNL
jgi:hypothetical protein